MRIVPVVLLTTLVVLGCHGGSNAPGSPFSGASLLTPLSDAEEAHDELLRADLGRADSVAKRGYAEGAVRRFATDVLYLRDGLPILRGRNAAQAVLAADSVAARSSVRWQPVRAEVSADGRTGYSYGYAIYGAGSGSGAPSLHLDRYIAFWRRDALGWKIAAYAETYSAPPAPVPLPRQAADAAVADVPMPRTYGALEAVRAADAAFAEMALKIGTGRAFGEYAAETAQIFSAPGELITGPRAISDAFGGDEKSTLTWHPVAGEVATSGDLGFTVGNALFNGRRVDGGPVTRYSKYLTVWKRQRDGGWKYVVDGGSARPADDTT